MIFVNEIARIVHGISIEYLGVPNKIIGGTFLIIWKIPESEIDYNEDINKPKIARNYIVNNIADCALIAFLKMICKINREPKIL